MKRDICVTVTRDSRVTSQVPRTCDNRDVSRVSHATTTTPHHTMFLLASGSRLSIKTKSKVTVTYASGLGFGAMQ